MSLAELVRQLVDQLAAIDQRLVLAESCTGGLVAAELAKIPGVSNWLCGSAVTYREDTKIRWLGVSADDIEQHTAVSQSVAAAMAIGVLTKTPEASWSASITGHLGPGAPSEFDGVIFIGIARRIENDPKVVTVVRHQLSSVGRTDRQTQAASWVLQELVDRVN